MSETRPTIEVCFTPALFQHIMTPAPYIVVVVDILRATTSICTAMANGVKEVIPVASREDALRFKEHGYLIAAEKDGIKLDFADFGNSPTSFMGPDVKGKSIVYYTTNGTHTIRLASGSNPVVIASFLNLKTVAKWLSEQHQNVVILCSGWKHKFNLEDSIFAGALALELSETYKLNPHCDSANAAIDLWKTAAANPLGYIEKAMHRERLKRLQLDDILEYSFKADQTKVVPLFDGFHITDALKPSL